MYIQAPREDFCISRKYHRREAEISKFPRRRECGSEGVREWGRG
jgi:hypothetical protein